MVYIIIFMAFLILLLVFKQFEDVKSLIDFIGFTGTVAGIILAVVALIYAFLQANAFGNASSKLDDSAKRIEVLSKSLDKINSLDEISTKLNETQKTVNDSIHGLRESVSHFHAATNESFDKLNNSIGNIVFPNIKSHPETLATIGTDSEEKIDQFIQFCDLPTLTTGYILVRCNEKKHTFNIYEYIDWAKENSLLVIFDKEDDSSISDTIFQRNVGVFFANYHHFAYHQYIKISGPFSNITVEVQNDYFINKIKQQFQFFCSAIGKYPTPYKDYIEFNNDLDKAHQPS